MYQIERIKQKLGRGEIVLGANSVFADSAISELFALAGYDFVWIDAEHSALDYKDIQQHIVAAQGAGACAFVRIMWNDQAIVKRVMDMGPDGVIFPLIHSVAEARAAVSACRYPPKGIRGWNPIRANQYGMGDHDEYLETVDDKVWKIFMIEHIEAVDDLDAVLSVEGVDAIIIGGSDLSASLGKMHQMDDPEVRAAMDKILPVAKKYHIPACLSAGIAPETVTEWLDKGVSMISVGQDANMLSKISQDYLASVRATCRAAGRRA